jgi:hypothetical protein
LDVRIPEAPSLIPRPSVAIVDELVDFEALFDASLGADTTDASTRAMVAQTAEAYDRVALRLGQRGLDLAVSTGRPADGSAALETVRFLRRIRTLNEEIITECQGGNLAIKGLLTGLNHSHRQLEQTYRSLTAALASGPDANPTGCVPTETGTADPILENWRDGAAACIPSQLEEDGAPITRLLAQLLQATEALRQGDHAVALTCATAFRDDALARKDGVGVAAGALLQMEAATLAGQSDLCLTIRAETGGLLASALAPAGVMLLARWRPASPQAG